MVGWTGRQKLKNPRRLYEFWLEKGWSQAKVARVFHVSRQRASIIINKYRGRDE